MMDIATGTTTGKWYRRETRRKVLDHRGIRRRATRSEKSMFAPHVEKGGEHGMIKKSMHYEARTNRPGPPLSAATPSALFSHVIALISLSYAESYLVSSAGAGMIRVPGMRAGLNDRSQSA